MKKLYEQYQRRRGWKKWLLQFILNWFYWGVVYGLMYLWFMPGEQMTTPKLLLMITLMALFWTLFYDRLIAPWIKKKFGRSS